MLTMCAKCCRPSKGHEALQGMSTLCRSQQVVHILQIMRWTTSLWEEFLMMNYTLLLLLLLKMKRIFQLSLWLLVTTRRGFVWRLLHHIFVMSMKSCKPSCPLYIFLPLFMNCCVSRWEIRTVVRPVFEQVSSYFILLFWNVVFVDVLWWLCPVQNGPPCALNGVMAMKQLTRCTCWNRYPLRGVFVSSTLQTSCPCKHELLERSVWVRWIKQSTVMYCTMCTVHVVLYCAVVLALVSVWSKALRPARSV